MPLILRHTDMRIQADKVWLDALLSFAPDVRGLVICAVPFAFRLRSTREHHTNEHLRALGYATLTVSLLTSYEETRDPDVRFDIPLLGQRLASIVTWVDQQPDLAGMPCGLLSSGTITAAAVRYLNREPERIAALVARAGRADLSGADPLRRLQTPTLMIVPDADEEYKKSAMQAYALLTCAKSWHPVRADSAFTDASALDAATKAAGAWFVEHVPVSPPRPIPAPGSESAANSEPPTGPSEKSNPSEP